jgi:hypothetical protein
LLEIYAEVGLYYFFSCPAGAIAEDQVVPHWLVESGGKAKAHILIMGRVDRINHVGGIAIKKICVLLLINQEKVDVPVFVAGLRSGIGSMQLGAGSVRRNFEDKLCSGSDGKRLVHDGGAGAYW